MARLNSFCFMYSLKKGAIIVLSISLIIAMISLVFGSLTMFILAELTVWQVVKIAMALIMIAFVITACYGIDKKNRQYLIPYMILMAICILNDIFELIRYFKWPYFTFFGDSLSRRTANSSAQANFTMTPGNYSIIDSNFTTLEPPSRHEEEKIFFFRDIEFYCTVGLLLIRWYFLAIVYSYYQFMAENEPKSGG